jgi:hypothetical protein
MGRSGWMGFALAVMGFCAEGAAQSPPPKTRIICDVNDPTTKCPGADCVCVEDSLAVTFDGVDESVFEYETFTADPPMSVLATTVMDVKTRDGAGIQGWSYGVHHDDPALEFVSVTTEGTDAKAVWNGGFDLTTATEVQTCDTVPGCLNRTPGGGWISAVVLSFAWPLELPATRNTLAKSEYKLLRDVGEDGTVIEFTERLAKARSPAQLYQLTIAGKSNRWTQVTDGWVKRKAAPAAEFLRGDANDDGRSDVSDPIWIISELMLQGPRTRCASAADANDDGLQDLSDAMYLISYAFLASPQPPAPFPSCGPDPTPDTLDCPELPGSHCR